MLRNNKGVTLVELLIVIVILGIIAAIAVPAVGNIVENAQKDAVIADATTIRSAINTYCLSEDDVACDEDNELINTELLAAYFDGDFEDYTAWQNGGTWYVALVSGDYIFAGNPNDNDTSRGDVEDAPDDDETITYELDIDDVDNVDFAADSEGDVTIEVNFITEETTEED